MGLLISCIVLESRTHRAGIGAVSDGALQKLSAALGSETKLLCHTAHYTQCTVNTLFLCGLKHKRPSIITWFWGKNTLKSLYW